MTTKKNPTEKKVPGDIAARRDRSNSLRAAHDQAEKDIENDPEFSAHSPNDDLDEGETARLGEEHTDLI